MADKYPSTTLPQNATPQEIQRAQLDMLKKVNETHALAQSAAVGSFVPLLPNPLLDGEPSLGTSHPTSDANRSATQVVNTSTNTAGVWSAPVTMTGVPAGAKSAYCVCLVNKAGVTVGLCVEAATGYTLDNTTVGTNSRKYHGIFSIVASGVAYGVVKVHLDSNGQFKWCTDVTNANVNIGSAIDYEM